MTAIKSYHQFLVENLSAEYNYYGPGSLYPLVAKLADEGKDAAFVYRYLTGLGIDGSRKRHVIERAFPGQAYGESLFEDVAVNEDEIDDLISAEVEDDLSGSKKKGDGKGKKDKDKDKDGEEDGGEEEDGNEEDGDEDGEEDEGTEDSDETAVIKRVLKDQGKLDRIRSILKESCLIDLPEDADHGSVREAESLMRSVEMGSESSPYVMFYSHRNDSGGTFLSAGAKDKADLTRLASLLNIQEYYVYRHGFKDLTEEGGGAEYLEHWKGPDRSFVGGYANAASKRIL